MDDGADLVGTIHAERRDLVGNILGGTEETTTGVIRLRSMAEKGVLLFPVIVVNDSNTKHLFDNRYGTGQSTVDGILRATNHLMAGSVFVVCRVRMVWPRFGHEGQGMGARVIVTEVDPLRAQATMDGYNVMPIGRRPLSRISSARLPGMSTSFGGNTSTMKNGAIVCNSGHFNVEIEIGALEKMATARRKIREMVEEFTMPDGRRIFLLGEGRLINLAAGEGHPASVMDMSFANQALAAELLVKTGKGLGKGGSQVRSK